MNQKNVSSQRESLTDEQLRTWPASKLLSLRLTKDEMVRLRAINEAKEARRQIRAARLAEEETFLVAELRQQGFDLNSVWDLIGDSRKHGHAIPILLKHLQMPYSDRTKDGIAHALALPEAFVGWNEIVREYRKAPTGYGVTAPGDTEQLPYTAKHTLAGCLAFIANESVMNELIALVQDTSLGKSRALLVAAIKKSNSESAKQVLADLKNDAELNKEIAADSSWL